MAQPRRALLREDWDFEFVQRDLEQAGRHYHAPSRFLQDLLTYEYARVVPRIVNAFRNDRRVGRRIESGTWRCFLVLPNASNPPFEDCFPHLHSGSYDVGWLDLGKLPSFDALPLVAPVGFPYQPFLRTNFQNVLYPEASRELPKAEPVGDIQRYGEGWINAAEQQVDPKEIVHLQVNWDHSDDVLLDSFKRRLKMRPRDPVDQRGKSELRDLYTDLKALGTWRLLRYFRGDIAAARSFCRKKAGKSHYERDDDWRKKRARAQRIIDSLSQREICG